MTVAPMLRLGAGLASGYLLASLTESALHKWIHHAPPWMRRRWRRIPWLGAALERSHFRHHVVHHLRTFRHDHVTQFADPGEKQSVDRAIEGADARYIQRTGYGLTIRGLGILSYVAPVLLLCPFMVWAGGPLMLAGAAVPFGVFVLMSASVHPWLHVPHATAIARAPRLVAWLLGTRYMRTVARHHFVHHRDPAFNFNLMLGGDTLLGVSRRASTRELEAMRRAGIRVD